MASFQDKVDSEHIDWLIQNDLLNRKIVYGVTHQNYEAMIDFGINKMIIDYHSSLDSELTSSKE